MFGKEDNERAVSPVVGVILMVAITVILAAVIGAFVLDLGSDQEENPTAGVTFEQETESGQIFVRVTVIDPGNVDSLTINNIDDPNFDERLEAEAGATERVRAELGHTVQVTGTVGTSEALIDSFDVE